MPEISLAEQQTPPLLTEKSPKVSLCRLACLNKPEIPVLIVGGVAAIINGMILPISALLISRVVKIFYEPPNELKKDSKFWAIMFVILGLASFLVIPARSYFFAVAGCKLIQSIRVLCFEKVIDMEVGWFGEHEHSTRAVGARLSKDAASIRALVGDALGQIVYLSVPVAKFIVKMLLPTILNVAGLLIRQTLPIVFCIASISIFHVISNSVR